MTRFTWGLLVGLGFGFLGGFAARDHQAMRTPHVVFVPRPVEAIPAATILECPPTRAAWEEWDRTCRARERSERIGR